MKKLTSLLVAGVMATALVACGGSGGDGQVLIAYCPPTLADPFLATTASKLGQYCEAEGMKFIATEGEFNIATQIQQIENFIAQGADLIVAQPVDVAAFESVVGQARSAGVKVMFIADDPTYDVEGAFLSVEEVQGQLVTEMASAWIDQAMPEAADGEVTVALLLNTDRPSSITRSDAIRDGILADSRATIVFEKAGMSDSVSAQTAMDECLAQNKDVNLVLCFDEALAIGANSSVMANGGMNKDQIAIFGANYTDAGADLIAQSTDNTSVIRGLVNFGDGDIYYTDMVDAICTILAEESPINTPFFAQHIAVNSIGYESSFDPAGYAANYVSSK